MREIAPAVYVETGYPGGNVGFVDTGEGIVCVDLPTMPHDTRQWIAAIEDTTAQPVVAVVQTDYDMPRVLSTDLVGAPLIAHEAVWEPMAKVYGRDRMAKRINELLGDGTDWQLRMPDVTFSEHLILKRGKKEIHVLHASGHTPGTSMIHVPNARLIFTGDLVFNGLHPTMQYAQSKAWLTALNRLRKMAVEIIVPGHGQVTDKEATYPLSEYIRQMRAMVRRSYRAAVPSQTRPSWSSHSSWTRFPTTVRRPIACQSRSRTAVTACTTSIALQIGPKDGEGSEETVGHDSQLCPVAIQARQHLVAAQQAIAVDPLRLTITDQGGQRMGAVPKSKISNRRRKNKRSHHALNPPNLMDCPQCGAKKLPHHVCLTCGHYRGIQVLEV